MVHCAPTSAGSHAHRPCIWSLPERSISAESIKYIKKSFATEFEKASAVRILLTETTHLYLFAWLIGGVRDNGSQIFVEDWSVTDTMEQDWNGSEDEADHVIQLDGFGPWPNQYPTQLSEEISGNLGEENQQIYDISGFGSFQSKGPIPPTSTSNPHNNLQGLYSSLPLPTGILESDQGFDNHTRTINPQDLTLLNDHKLSNSVLSSSTSSNSVDMPSLTSSSNTVGADNKSAVPPHTSLYLSKSLSRKVPSYESRPSLIDSPINQRKSRSNARKKCSRTAQPQRDLARLELSLRSNSLNLSTSFRQLYPLLLTQLSLLLQKEFQDGRLEPDFDDMSVTTSTSPHSVVNFDLTESVSRIEASSAVASSVSSTPRPLILQDSTAMEEDREARVKYSCTYPDCRVTQKECKYNHTKCSCSTKLEPYWSDSKVDIKRHEMGLNHWPQKTFLCLRCLITDETYGFTICQYCYLPTPGDPETAKAHYIECEHSRAKMKTFSRKDHLIGHLRRKHGLENMGETTKSWSVRNGRPWPRECGFCSLHFDSWDQRMSHIACHFEQGCKIEDWSFRVIKPKDKEPSGPFPPNYRKDDDDDDEDDDDSFGGGGDSSHGKIPRSGNMPNAAEQTGYNQAPSSQESAAHDQQGRYHRNCAALRLPAVATEYDHQYAAFLPMPGKLSVALERYLTDPGDRVPRLGAAPKPSKIQILQSVPSKQSQSRAVLPNARFTDNLVICCDCAGSKRLQLIRQYVSHHWKSLDQGIFWPKAKMRSEVKDSFFDIVIHTIDPSYRYIRSQNIRHNLVRESSLMATIRPGGTQLIASKLFLKQSASSTSKANRIRLLLARGITDGDAALLGSLAQKGRGFNSKHQSRQTTRLLAARIDCMILIVDLLVETSNNVGSESDRSQRPLSTYSKKRLVRCGKNESVLELS